MYKLPFNEFDLLLGSVLVFGLVQGRKHGMSGEWVVLLKWLAIVLGCALVYWPVACLISAPGFFSIVSACLIAYLGATLLIFLGFSWLQRRLRPQQKNTDFFGRTEYYMGMASGLVRATCIVLVTLALLNARTFTPAEVRAIEANQSSTYGSHVFPSLPGVQAEVFERSLSGRWIKQNLGFLLIQAEENEAKRKT